MKRSEINHLFESASACFLAHGWALPPTPRWDVTDFGLGNWRCHGLVLVNLAEHPEYCEKLMYARRDMQTPAHCHRLKKEDIICRWGVLRVQIWPAHPHGPDKTTTTLLVNNAPRTVPFGGWLDLNAGERVTLVPGVYHAFHPTSDECIIGEVSTANDDISDNIFVSPDIGRFPEIEEDAPSLVRLIRET